ncbi:MAG: hypothetical protein KatS3mg061_1871 [Dehalococcoidia bacterium]|nr:MAG: hypothetical protein KatS3mg061_1871 [Dehalococcoidia bacterium]
MRSEQRIQQATQAMHRLAAGRLRQPGPRPGDGRNAHKPWRGIVEETPRLWAQWLQDAWQRHGRRGWPVLAIDDQRIEIVTVRRTFGEQGYFRCPGCDRRCAFLCLPPSQPAGCYRCCRLGYRSQRSRPDSAWAILEAVFSREGRVRLVANDARMLKIEGGEAMVASLRRQLAEAIDAMIRRVDIDEETGDGTAAE